MGDILLDLGTMKILSEKIANAEYIIIKIGDKTYSTSYSDIKNGKDISIAKNQAVDTAGIGKQNNLWIKGKFTEGKYHNKFDMPIPFELNVYTKLEKGE
jgi:hypothetical protein